MTVPNQLSIHLLGEPRLLHDGVCQPLPPSRKTRALLAYLALNPKPQRRDVLGQLLWVGASDERAALRWSLSRLRALLTDAKGAVLHAGRDSVRLEGERVEIDVVEIRRSVDAAGGTPDDASLARVVETLEGGFLDGLEDVGSPEFRLWLESERASVHALHGGVLETLLARAATPSLALTFARRRVALSPLDVRANVTLLRLTREVSGQTVAHELLSTVRALFRAEAMSDEPLLAAWAGMSAARLESPADEHTAYPRLVESGPPPDEIVAPELPTRPSVAVLGFENVGDPETGGVFATGLAVDLTSRLSQLRYLFVVARASAARFAKSALSPREIGRRLGVRYLVTGTAQRNARHVRVTINVIDAANESEIWSEHYDRSVDDLFLVQDEIAGAVVAAIEPAIEAAEMERALLAPPDGLDAWENFHRGLWHCFRFTARDNEFAHHFLGKAVALDPRFSRAYAGLSLAHYSRAFLRTVRDVGAEVEKSLELAHISVDLDGRDSMGHWSLGRALLMSKRHDEALSAIERSLSANPNYALGHYAKGYVAIHAGLDLAALPSLEAAQRLSPFDPLLFAIKGSRAIGLANQGRYDEAADWGIRATQEPNAHFHIFAIAAACLELSGRSEEARSHARATLERKPEYSVQIFRSTFPHRDEAFREPTLAALLRAGIPRGS